jgi:hypothetical protein
MRLFAAALTAAFFSLAYAQAQPVDLQLVLAVDTSGSVDATRFELQKQGYIAAFRNPRVLHAAQSGPHGAIAVTMTQWTGPALQAHVVPWTVIKDDASSRAALRRRSRTRHARSILAAPRSAVRSITPWACSRKRRSRARAR